MYVACTGVPARSVGLLRVRVAWVHVNDNFGTITDDNTDNNNF
jgi:hypothetical protein